MQQIPRISRKPIVVLMAALMPLLAQAVPSFPGAEGFGAETVGGRGGKVYTVTHLNDEGEGSLRAAVEAQGPRTVVFAVSGTIQLKSPLIIKNPNITIAGQTAPGGGITLRDYTLHIDTQEVIVRYIRSRLGNASKVEEDAINIRDGARNVILDHVSASWSTDEALSPSGDIKNITVQWSLIAESLNKSVHLKGAHGYGSLLRATGGVSLHHNIWAFHRGRNPRFGDNYMKGDGTPTFDFRNNIITAWGDYASGTNDGNIRVNYVDNLIKPGKFSVKIEPIVVTDKGNENTQFYLKGNVFSGNNAWSNDNSKLIGWGAPPKELSKEAGKYKLAAAPFDAPKVTTWPAGELLIRLPATVGASYPWRDAVDLRIIEQITENKGKLIDSQEEVGSWPAVPQGTAALDSDGDGIPDAWEKAHGLNAKDASDGAKLAKDKSGYTNLERYLNSLLAEPEPEQDAAKPAKARK